MLLQSCISLLFPEYCFSCRKIGAYVCGECSSKLKYAAIIHRCPGFLGRIHFCTYGGVFKKTLWGAKYFSVKGAIHELLEYIPNNDIHNGFATLGLYPDSSCLVPVPLHPRRLRERGFNQAEIIADVLSSRTGVPVETDIVRRTKYTSQQARLTREERLKNMQNAFRMSKHITGKTTVIVVDDVWTTGSTIRAMAQCLQDAGVRDIYALTLAG